MKLQDRHVERRHCLGASLEAAKAGAIVVEHAVNVGAAVGLPVALLDVGGFATGDHHREHLRIEAIRCIGALELGDVVGGRRLLRCGVLANRHVAGRMGEVADDQFVYPIGMEHGETPGDGTSPVVADEGHVLFAEIVDHGGDIGHEQVHRVVLDSLRFPALVVGPRVHGHRLETSRERLHLISPGVPEVGETVHEKDGGPFSQGHVVNVDTVTVDGVMLDGLKDVGRVCAREG